MIFEKAGKIVDGFNELAGGKIKDTVHTISGKVREGIDNVDDKIQEFHKNIEQKKPSK